MRRRRAIGLLLLLGIALGGASCGEAAGSRGQPRTATPSMADYNGDLTQPESSTYLRATLH